MLFFLMNTPFNFIQLCTSTPQKALTCYCCDNKDKTCTMIFCSGCRTKTGLDFPQSTQEMAVCSLYPTIHMAPIDSETESANRPETVYLEIPDRPPDFT